MRAQDALDKLRALYECSYPASRGEVIYRGMENYLFEIARNELIEETAPWFDVKANYQPQPALNQDPATFVEKFFASRSHMDAQRRNW